MHSMHSVQHHIDSHSLEASGDEGEDFLASAVDAVAGSRAKLQEATTAARCICAAAPTSQAANLSSACALPSDLPCFSLVRPLQARQVAGSISMLAAYPATRPLARAFNELREEGMSLLRLHKTTAGWSGAVACNQLVPAALALSPTPSAQQPSEVGESKTLEVLLGIQGGKPCSSEWRVKHPVALERMQLFYGANEDGAELASHDALRAAEDAVLSEELSGLAASLKEASLSLQLTLQGDMAVLDSTERAIQGNLASISTTSTELAAQSAGATFTFFGTLLLLGACGIMFVATYLAIRFLPKV